MLRNDYGAYSTKDVVVSVLDVDEYNVTTPYDANPSSSYVSENSSYGATVGITALAFDLDGMVNTITYSDNSGLFSVHPSMKWSLSAALLIMKLHFTQRYDNSK